jgi:hypothetical protein
MEDKYRKVKKQNPAFSVDWVVLQYGDAAMKAAGFVPQTTADGEEVYMMEASAGGLAVPLRTKAAVDAAAREPRLRPPILHRLSAPAGGRYGCSQAEECLPEGRRRKHACWNGEDRDMSAVATQWQQIPMHPEYDGGTYLTTVAAVLLCTLRA